MGVKVHRHVEGQFPAVRDKATRGAQSARGGGVRVRGGRLTYCAMTGCAMAGCAMTGCAVGYCGCIVKAGDVRHMGSTVCGVWCVYVSVLEAAGPPP